MNEDRHGLDAGMQARQPSLSPAEQILPDSPLLHPEITGLFGPHGELAAALGRYYEMIKRDVWTPQTITRLTSARNLRRVLFRGISSEKNMLFVYPYRPTNLLVGGFPPFPRPSGNALSAQLFFQTRTDLQGRRAIDLEVIDIIDGRDGVALPLNSSVGVSIIFDKGETADIIPFEQEYRVPKRYHEETPLGSISDTAAVVLFEAIEEIYDTVSGQTKKGADGETRRDR